MIRAIVVLETERATEGIGRRALRMQRRALTEAAERSVEAATDDIADIVKKFGGHLLRTRLNSLSSLAVETTPAGIKALTDSPHVRVILEDQSLSLISK